MRVSWQVSVGSFFCINVIDVDPNILTMPKRAIFFFFPCLFNMHVKGLELSDDRFMNLSWRDDNLLVLLKKF